MKKTIWLLACTLVLWTCSTTQKAPKTTEEVPELVAETLLDTLEVVESAGMGEDENAEDISEDSTPKPYTPSRPRINDLLHTRLELSFDWTKEEVMGKASLKFKPYFNPSSVLELDAKGFEIKSVTVAGSKTPLNYTYAEDKLKIQLGRAYTRNEEYGVDIEYIARPKASGGSSAITSNQGLFFINPRKEDPDKPQQIWTQGETEWNSRWFPTIDSPNERCTQEVYVTVDKKFVTLSNGVMASSVNNPNGTRTDYWKMDLPHAPYLFMLAIGEFAVVKDKWRNIEVNYYVEPAYEADARDIFAHTPEMLEFFSNRLGVTYPWPKYSQVVVRDYVSGAMENTTATIFGDFVQKHKWELIDDFDNQKIVAHELFHHWFGDYVTCESWPNLSMNEGFANYSEYLWFEKKYGRDRADHHLMDEHAGYLGGGGIHPLIHFAVKDKDDMFDAHTYNKGGSILHMLRTYLGDEVFFTALKNYLTQNAFKSVEAHNLRLAMEEVSGEDLNWFFNQWYFSAGHPILNISYSYDEASKEAVVEVEQTQSTEDGTPAVFTLPLKADVYLYGEKKTYDVWLKERKQTFRFPAASKPNLVNLDGDRALLCEFEDNKTEEELAFQFKNSNNFRDRIDAFNRLLEGESDLFGKALEQALDDPYWFIRSQALDNLNEDLLSSKTARLREIAEKDSHSECRAKALSALAEADDPEILTVAKAAFQKDPALAVAASALQVINQKNSAEGLALADQLVNGKDNRTAGPLLEAIAEIYGSTGDQKYMSFFEQNMFKVDGPAALSFYDNLQILLSKSEPALLDKVIEKMNSVSMSSTHSLWRRFASTRAINSLRNEFKVLAARSRDTAVKTSLSARAENLTKMIEAIKANEKNEELIGVYGQLPVVR
jgi:aminopeptidase N